MRVFPWPSKRERRARIEAARIEAEHTREQAQRAMLLAESLRNIDRDQFRRKFQAALSGGRS